MQLLGMYLGNMLGDESFTDYIIDSRINEAIACIESSHVYEKMTEQEREVLLQEFENDIRQKFNRHRNIEKENILHSALLGTLKNILGLHGMGAIVDGACSGSGLVIDEAIKSIHNGDNDVCIASAVLGNMVVTGNIGFAKIGGLSKKNGSRPMDYMADGLVPGEGAGTLVLKDLKRAEQDGDTIYAVIRGSGVASDGKGKSIYAPSSTGQVKAMRKSLERAGLDVTDIDYIETHATGTMVGDKIELNSIKELLKSAKLENKKIALGSIKSQIGHSFSAAGMANIIKVIEGIRHKQLPPTHKFTRLPDGVSFEGTPLYINTSVKDWETEASDIPRRAMVNAFGFGGINANVLIEEYLPSNTYSEEQEDVNTDIAIVGIGCLDAIASDIEVWHQAINSKENGLQAKNIKRKDDTEISVAHMEEMKFPFLKFKIPPTILAQIDRSQQIALMTAGKAICGMSSKIDPHFRLNLTHLNDFRVWVSFLCYF